MRDKRAMKIILRKKVQTHLDENKLENSLLLIVFFANDLYFFSLFLLPGLSKFKKSNFQKPILTIPVLDNYLDKL